MLHRSSRRGFTLIELMVVIGIIALLIGIAIPAFNTVRKRAKATSTQATISTIETGLESFRTDSKLGGQYPPSFGVVSGGSFTIANPHLPAGNKPLPYVQGANLLVWALAGADLLGTPGFRDLGNDRTDPFGGWLNDVGSTPNQAPLQAYALSNKPGRIGEPEVTRSGPFVDIAKVATTKKRGTDSSGNITFLFDGVDVNPAPFTYSQCFLDSFNQPLIYYRANAGKALMVDDAEDPFQGDGTTGDNSNDGTYNLNDNLYITGDLKPNQPGVDLGAGQETSGPASGKANHPMSYLGDADFDLLKPPAANNRPAQGSFAHRVWNQGVSAKFQAQNADGYILLSAGPDGRFGTSDDVGNIPIE